MKTTRRRILAGAAAAASSTVVDAAVAQLLKNESPKPRAQGAIRPKRAGNRAPLATLTLVNDGASATPAGTPTQSFGWIFNDGDIAPGMAPRFEASGLNQNFSTSVPSMRRYYPSGCLEFAVFALRPHFSVRAGGSQPITISSGGSWPSPSDRNLEEIYNQNLAVSCPAASPSGSNLSGTWGAWCKSDTNLINSGAMAPIVDLDGDAGKRWRISVRMAQSQGGTPHGQLVFDFYIWALNDDEGKLGGFRWSGYVRQPWYNLSGEGTSVPTKNFRAFAQPDYSRPSSGPHWTASGVTPTPMGFKGSNNKAMIAVPFTAKDGHANAENHNYWLGGPDGTVIPCYFTTTGTLPSPLNTSNIYFVVAGTDANLTIFSSSRADGSSRLTLSGGSGTHRIHPVPCVAQFTRLAFKDDNARYLFFQGSGSLRADTTIRAQIDRGYWQGSGLLPPFDLTKASVPNGGSVSDTQFTNLWNPHTIGTCERDQDGAAGDVQCIGILPNDAIIDFYNQSAKSEKAVRCMGLASCQIPLDFKDTTTDSIVNVSSNSYKGLPSSVGTTVAWGNYVSGFTAPPSGGYGMGFTSVGSTEHQPAWPFWAWLRFGELEFWDFIKEQAVLGLLSTTPNRRNTDKPVAGRKGLSLGFEIEYRTLAWRKRNVDVAALFGPFDPNNPDALGLDGTQSVKYFIDLSEVDYQQVKDASNAANNYYGLATAYFTARGMWTPFCDLPDGARNNYLTVSPEWEFAFIVYCACLSAARGSSNAIEFLNQAATRWNYYQKTYGGANGGLYNMAAYYTGWGPESSKNSHIGPSVMKRDQDWGITANYVSGSTAWSRGTSSAFTFSSVMWSNSYSPHNGDIIYWAGNYPPIPSGLSENVGYFIVNYNPITQTFGVSDTLAGPAKAISNTGSNAVFSVIANTNAPATDWSNRNPPFSLGPQAVLQIRAACCWAKAVLAKQRIYSKNFEALLSDLAKRLANTPGGPYPTVLTLAGGWSDVRYAYADHYGLNASK